MKKILIINDHFPPDHWGGANSIAYLQAKGLQKKGYAVRVFVTTQDRDRAGVSTYEGVPVRAVYTEYHPRWWAWRSLYNPPALRGLRQELDDFAPDIVHCHNIHHYVSYRAIALARSHGAKVFLTAHDVMSFAYQKLHNFIDYSALSIPQTFNYHVPWWINARDARKRYNPLRNLVIRHYLGLADQVFAVSHALKQALADNGIGGNVSVVHNGLDLQVFTEPYEVSALKEAVGIHGPVVLFVGRFTPDKGRDVLLKAFAQVVKEVPQARLLVVGFKEDRRVEPVMWQIIDELQIEEKIVFVPAVEYINMHRYYRLADVVVVPSIIFDAFPTANLEGMAAGKPVIATCFGGSREAVVDGETGYIVNPLNVEILSEKILTLITDRSLAGRLGTTGKERLIQEFTLDNYIATIEPFYKGS